MKGDIEMAANWSIRNREFTTSDLQLAIKDWIHKSTRDELDYRPEDYLTSIVDRSPHQYF